MLKCESASGSGLFQQGDGPSVIIQLQTSRWFVSSSNIFKYIDGNCQDKRQEHLRVTPLLINVWDRDSKWGINNVCFAAISSWFPIFLIFISCLLQTRVPCVGADWAGDYIKSMYRLYSGSLSFRIICYSTHSADQLPLTMLPQQISSNICCLFVDSF